MKNRDLFHVISYAKLKGAMEAIINFPDQDKLTKEMIVNEISKILEEIQKEEDEVKTREWEI